MAQAVLARTWFGEIGATDSFAGIPEGGVASNLFLLTYLGGDGNDVAVKRMVKPLPWLTLDVDPQPGYLGEESTLTATVGSPEYSSMK